MVMDENVMTAGLEIHQQLGSKGKLYCRCPNILRKDEPDVILHRKLHAVAGETGDIDVAVKHEYKSGKEFIYQGYSDTNCLLEFDECPPFEIDSEALKISIQISLLFHCEIVPVTQIMRKTVIDGSNTGGFQRTVLIGRNGYINTKSGKVGIWYVYLEEDAARTIGEEKGKKIYRLDRLGIPLVEVVTAPDIKTPEQAKEVALEIGDILRSCKVKRGLGTIRQDINVSIPGHPRAEIKGFQDPDIFVDVVKKEIERQKLDIKNKKNNLLPEVRGANPDATTRFLRPLPGSARMYPETDLPLLRISRKMIDDAKKTLPELRSVIRKDLKNRGLNEEQIKILLSEDKLDEFKSLLKIINDVNFVYKALIEIPKEVTAKDKTKIKLLNEDIVENLLDLIKKGRLDRSDLKYVMQEIVSGKNFKDAIKIEKIDSSEVEAEIAKIVKEKPGLSIGGYMGLVMAKFKGKISGKEASGILRKLIS